MDGATPDRDGGLLIYDGDCAFCTRTAEWAARRAGERATVAPWTAVDLDAHGLTVEQVTTQAWWVGADGHAEGGHRAVARALLAIGGAWGVVGRVLGLRALAPLARPGYALVARYRHRLPGGTAACRLPTSPQSPPER